MSSKGSSRSSPPRTFGSWTEQKSSSGRLYYYNKQSEISTWEKPNEWRDHERRERAQQAVLEEALINADPSRAYLAKQPSGESSRHVGGQEKPKGGVNEKPRFPPPPAMPPPMQPGMQQYMGTSPMPHYQGFPPGHIPPPPPHMPPPPPHGYYGQPPPPPPAFYQGAPAPPPSRPLPQPMPPPHGAGFAPPHVPPPPPTGSRSVGPASNSSANSGVPPPPPSIPRTPRTPASTGPGSAAFFASPRDASIYGGSMSSASSSSQAPPPPPPPPPPPLDQKSNDYSRSNSIHMSSPSPRTPSSVGGKRDYQHQQSQNLHQQRMSTNKRPQMSPLREAAPKRRYQEESTSSRLSRNDRQSIDGRPSPDTATHTPASQTPASQASAPQISAENRDQRKTATPPVAVAVAVADDKNKLPFAEMLKYYDPEGANEKMKKLGLLDVEERKNIKTLRRHGIHLENQLNTVVMTMEMCRSTIDSRVKWNGMLGERRDWNDTFIQRVLQRSLEMRGEEVPTQKPSTSSQNHKDRKNSSENDVHMES